MERKNKEKDRHNDYNQMASEIQPNKNRGPAKL